MTDFNTRNQNLINLSQMAMCGQVTHKIDQIASIYINGRAYFNVFRRYNSPYNIVIEDYNGDIYLHQDLMIRESLKTILCLTDYASNNIYTLNATSFKHNGPVPSLAHNMADMRWSEIQAKYQAVSVNFGGILYDSQDHLPISSNQEDEDRSTLLYEPGLVASYGPEVPQYKAPQYKPSNESVRKRKAEDNLDELLRTSATARPVFEHLSKKRKEREDHKEQEESIKDDEESQKCQLIRNSHGTCVCECDEADDEEEEEEKEEEEEEDEDEDEEEEEEEDEEEEEEEEVDEEEEEEEQEDSRDDKYYVVLRNGNKIRKVVKY